MVLFFSFSRPVFGKAESEPHYMVSSDAISVI